MKVSEFIEKIRFDLVDTDRVEYSDATLVEYLNRVISFLSAELIKLRFHGLIKSVSLSLSNGQATLPDDFVVEEAVIDPKGNELMPVMSIDAVNSLTYKIAGNSIYSDNDSVTLWYYYQYPSVSGLEDDLPVKDYMLNLVKEMVVFLALNRNEFNTTIEQALAQTFRDQILKIAGFTGMRAALKRTPYVL